MRIKTYFELRRLPTFEERYEYLKIGGQVGDSTFGFDRYLNQRLYHSYEWKKNRDIVIVRDNGCDLGIEDYPIKTHIVVHHMNPITVEDIEEGSDLVFNPCYLISTTTTTHLAIHYGNQALLPKKMVNRRPGDTRLWGL